MKILGRTVARPFIQHYFPDTEEYEEFVFDYLRQRHMPEELGYLE